MVEIVEFEQMLGEVELSQLHSLMNNYFHEQTCRITIMAHDIKIFFEYTFFEYQ